MKNRLPDPSEICALDFKEESAQPAFFSVSRAIEIYLPILEIRDEDSRSTANGKVDELRSRLTKWNCRFDSWDVFLADRARALAASEAILARRLPDD